MRPLRRRLAALLVPVILAGCQTGAAPNAGAVATVPTSAQVRSDTARGPFVAAANPVAAEAGMAVLRRGGSAVDAAVAIQAVLGLVEPQSSGLGGGAFLMAYDAGTGAVTAYDGRETAPASATPEL
ncbi:MAG TPA: gamma-glutamyltransferase, partial [Brevundimonas sp.]|nr:gamma-glutamyltransferase [Brevundimonas sp.]